MRTLYLLIACITAVGCSAEREPGALFGPSEGGTLVVDALLIVDQPLPGLFVREAAAPGEVYTRDAAAVTNATVVIEQGDRTFLYTHDADSLGRYLPPNPPPMVMPDTEYRLTVEVGSQTVRGVTLTPGRFQVREAVLLDEGTLQVRRAFRTFAEGEDVVFGSPDNRVVYQDGLLEARFDRIDVPGYQVGIVSLDRNSERVLDADFLEEDDYEDLERHGSSPAFVAPDGKVRLPWFAIYFAGRHMIRVLALDQNWYDYARSSPENNNGAFGGLAGDSFERPIFRLEGGVGIFGSASVDSLGFVVVPKE